MTDTELQNTESCERELQQQTQERYVAPRSRIVETGEAFVITAEMPGVGKDGVEVTIENDQLVITGRRAESADYGRTLYRESRPASYRRAFNLEGLVNPEQVQAKIEHGVLRVELHKAEALKPRKIELQV